MKKILLVESARPFADSIATNLRFAGYVVRISSNGYEALKALSDFLPDLIVTDVNMPLMSGMELIKRIRADEKYRQIPVVVLSSDKEASELAKTEQIIAFLKKSLPITELVDDLDKMLH